MFDALKIIWRKLSMKSIDHRKKGDDMFFCVKYNEISYLYSNVRIIFYDSITTFPKNDSWYHIYQLIIHLLYISPTTLRKCSRSLPLSVYSSVFFFKSVSIFAPFLSPNSTEIPTFRSSHLSPLLLSSILYLKRHQWEASNSFRFPFESLPLPFY